MKRMSRQGETVPTMSLSDLFDTAGIERCSFMKLNCEGAEFPILQTARPEILQRIDCMLVLYHCDIAAGYELEELSARLSSSGFRLRFTNQTRHRGWIIAVRS